MTSFVVWAMRQREDLVSADYYEREVRYQQQLDSLNRSQAFSTQVVVTFDPAQQAILITLPAARGATGRVHLYRPSDARLDRELPLALNDEGVQRLGAKELSGGLWKVRVNWTAQGKEYFLDQPVIVTPD
jgi:nitrogen fixation protein FixH